MTSNNSATVVRPQLEKVEGVPLKKPIVDNWNRISTFQALPDDLLIATYPKSGTTWMQEIVDFIYNQGDVEKCQRAPIKVRSPFLEHFSPGIKPALDCMDSIPSPRIIKTHLPFSLLPKSFLEQDCKIIYVARNAKDDLVSYYYFEKMILNEPEPGTWEQFFIKFITGNVGWGSWYDHVKGWWEKKDKHQILYMFYEEMKQNPKQEIMKVAKFLERELPDQIIDAIVQNTSFATMRDNPMANYSTTSEEIMDVSVSQFMRKRTSIVGDWKNHFTVAQNELFDAEYAKKMSGTSLTFQNEL